MPPDGNLIFIPQCDKAVRAELLANITLSGGNTKFPGMEKRVYQVSHQKLSRPPLYSTFCQELEGLLPVRTLKEAVKVRALPHRDMLGWVGAARYPPKIENWDRSLLVSLADWVHECQETATASDCEAPILFAISADVLPGMPQCTNCTHTHVGGGKGTFFRISIKT